MLNFLEVQFMVVNNNTILENEKQHFFEVKHF